MKKATALILILGVTVAAMCGCGKGSDTTVDPTPVSVQTEDVISAEPEEEEEPVEEVDPHIGEARSDLTGEWIDEDLASQRPFAIMIGNTKAATPQYGIGDADIIYECTVEGSETRLMAIFQDYQDVTKIMSIRSCRRYYIDWALEFDAIYGHYGQAYLAKEELAQSYVNNLSGLDSSLENTMYFRDSSLKAPHNAYTTGEGIVTGISIKGYETRHADSYTSHYQFNENDEQEIQLASGQDAVVVQPGYAVNKPWFVYDEATGLYRRYQNDAEQIDANTGEQLQVKNILIQECSWTTMDEEKGYLEFYTTSGGSGYYITNGKAIPVTWSKESQTAATRYFDSNGNEITLNQGKTWVCVTQDNKADRIHIYATEEEFNN